MIILHSSRDTASEMQDMLTAIELISRGTKSPSCLRGFFVM